MRLSFLPFHIFLHSLQKQKGRYQLLNLLTGTNVVFLLPLLPNKEPAAEQELRVQQGPGDSKRCPQPKAGTKPAGTGAGSPLCAPSQAMARTQHLHTQFSSLILTQSQLQRANEMCTLPTAAEVKILSTERIEAKRWENHVPGLKTISGLAGLGWNIDRHEQLPAASPVPPPDCCPGYCTKWIKWTHLRLPGNPHAANSQIFRELSL